MPRYKGGRQDGADAELRALRIQKARIDNDRALAEEETRFEAEKKLLRIQITEAGETPCA